MERLVSAYLDGDIPKEIYLKRKDKTMRSLAALKEKKKACERRGNTWVDPYRISTPCGSFVSQSSQKPSQGLAKLGRTSFSPLWEWVNDTKQAAFLSSSDNFSEIARFVQKIGTNHAVRDKTARFAVPVPSHFVAKRRAFLPTPAPCGRGQSALSSDEVRFCAEGRARTADPLFFRQVLYQLSYLSKYARARIIAKNGCVVNRRAERSLLAYIIKGAV